MRIPWWHNHFPFYFQDVRRNSLLAVGVITMILYQQQLLEERPLALSTPDQPPPREKDQAPVTIIEIETDTSEKLKIDPALIRYAEAKDNYVAHFWASGDTCYKKLLRMSLSSLETQLPEGIFFRCHRSYLINLKAVQKVEGNAYRLMLTL